MFRNWLPFAKKCPRRPAAGPGRRPLGVEALDDRTLPSVTAALSAGSLLVTGSPTVPGDTVRVAGQGNGLTQVFDGASLVGSYAVTKDLTVRLDDGDANLVIDLGGRTVGNLTAGLGAGAHAVRIGSGRASALNVTGGSGDETVTVSGLQVSNLTAIDTGTGTDQVRVDPTVSLRDLKVLNAEAVDLTTSQIGGNVTINNSSAPMAVTSNANVSGSFSAVGLGGSLALGGQVKGNLQFGAPLLSAVAPIQLTLTGSVGGTVQVSGTAFDDSVTFAAGSDVGQDVTVNLYDGADSVTLAGEAGNGHSSILWFDLGAGTDSATVAATARLLNAGNYLMLGDGDDVATVEAGVTLFPVGLRVDGGAGADTLYAPPADPWLSVINVETTP
jgi:hypothetical protein